MTDYVAVTETLLDRARSEEEPYDVDIQGVSFTVHPEVFSPSYFGSTHFMVDAMPWESGRCLDLGTGTGVLAVLLAMNGADSVVGTDISEDAVRNAQENVERHGVEDVVDVRRGDLFGPVSEGFDAIYWNTPFQDPSRECSEVEKQLFDPGYEMLDSFLSSFTSCLRVGGSASCFFRRRWGRRGASRPC